MNAVQRDLQQLDYIDKTPPPDPTNIPVAKLEKGEIYREKRQCQKFVPARIHEISIVHGNVHTIVRPDTAVITTSVSNITIYNGRTQLHGNMPYRRYSFPRCPSDVKSYPATMEDYDYDYGYDGSNVTHGELQKGTQCDSIIRVTAIGARVAELTSPAANVYEREPTPC
jgi:hypothetical protein